MRHLFHPARQVRCYARHMGAEHADVLTELLASVSRALERTLPLAASREVDRDGSTLHTGEDGRLRVRRHPHLQRALDALREIGVARIFADEAHGGFGLPLGVYYMVVQQVAYFDTSLALFFLVHGNAIYAINRYGTAEQKQRYLPALVSGERLATVAFTEPTAGSDAGSIRTRATRRGESWVLSGDKLWITHGGDADLLVTTARTGPAELGIAGVSTFIVEREADGVELTGLEHKTGLGGSPTAALHYPEIVIPAQRLLGPEGHGGRVMFAGVGMTRVNIAAQALGIARRAFDAAVDFALQREQGGSRIVEHDAIQQRLVQMALAISAIQGLICRDSALEARGEWHVREISEAKTFAAEALQPLTSQAIAVHGGYGCSRSYDVERCRREAVALPLYGGTTEIQWYIIARELLQARAGASHADYAARDEAVLHQLRRRAAGQATVLCAVERWGQLMQQQWEAVDRVAQMASPAPFHRHLTQLSLELAACQVLLWDATADDAEPLERELCRMAIHRLELAAQRHVGQIERGRGWLGAKAALRDQLRG